MSQSPCKIEIVEPTLEDYAGHCFGLVASLCRSLPRGSARVWAAKKAAALQMDDARIEPRFDRRWRLVQGYMLYRRLLARGCPIIVTTARSNDLRLLDLAATGAIAPRKVCLYFHWMRDTTDKRRFMQRMARKQPNLVMLGTTPTVTEFLRDCGFPSAALQPYPMTTIQDGSAPQAFRHLLYAGAARRDKGFGRMVDLVEYLARQKDTLRVTIQASADHYGKYDAVTTKDVQRLDATGYPHLTILRDALTPAAYAEMFSGAICVQAYDREDFRDRVSGVTLDAFSRACPVIATEGTWSARLAAQYGAGVAVGDHGAPALYSATRRILDDYATFSANALAAGREESKRSWEPLLQRIGLG